MLAIEAAHTREGRQRILRQCAAHAPAPRAKWHPQHAFLDPLETRAQEEFVEISHARSVDAACSANRAAPVQELRERRTNIEISIAGLNQLNPAAGARHPR